MAQITYTNKVALNENPEIANINKVTDDDMNEIKQVVNDNYNNTIQITDTEPTDSDNKIWIDTAEVGSAVSEITNEYSTSTGKGYSANYVNKLHTYSSTEQRVGTWFDRPLYRKTYIGTITSETTNYLYHEFYLDVGVNVFSIRGMVYSSANNVSNVIPSRENTDAIFFRDATPRIRIYVYDKTNIPIGSSYNLTIEYTKTTD